MTEPSHLPKNETEWIEEAVLQILKTHGAVTSATRLVRSKHPTPDYEVSLPDGAMAWLEVTQLTDSEARMLFNEGSMEILSDHLLEHFVLLAKPGASYKRIREYEHELIALLVKVEQHRLSVFRANRQLAQANLRIVHHEHRGRQGRVVIHPTGRMDRAIFAEAIDDLQQGVQSCIDKKDNKGQMSNAPQGYSCWLAVWVDLLVGEAFLEINDRETWALLELDTRCFDVIWMISKWNDQATLLAYPGAGIPAKVPFDATQLEASPSPLILPNEGGSSGFSRLWTPSRS